MTQFDNDRAALVHRRLYGSVNRIHWRSHDIAAIEQHIGGHAPAVAPPMQRYTAPPLAASAAMRSAPSNSRSFTFTISTSSVDRYGDTVAVGGWKLAAYKKNPVVLWAHDSGLIPVGRATSIWIEGQRLKSTVELAPADANPAAEQVNKLIQGGYLCATSVGFLPLKYAFADSPERKYGIDFLEQELLEYSIVPVPANSECLIDAGQSGSKALRGNFVRAGMTPAERRRRIEAVKRRK